MLSQSIDTSPSKNDLVKKLIYISLIQIFIAHATIHDAQSQAKEEDKDLTIEESLEIAFKQELPRFALS